MTSKIKKKFKSTYQHYVFGWVTRIDSGLPYLGMHVPKSLLQLLLPAAAPANVVPRRQQ